MTGPITVTGTFTVSGAFSAQAGLFRTSANLINGSATDRGYGIFGTSGGAQVQIDNDEIQAMNNTAVSTLNLNIRGGNISVGFSSSFTTSFLTETNFSGRNRYSYTSSGSTPVTLDASNIYYASDPTAGATTITIPSSVLGAVYTILKIGASANTTTIQGTGGQTIDGAATVVLGGNLGISRLTVVGDGTNWRILELYEEGTYTATLTGCTTSPTATVSYVRNGKSVVLRIANFLATSNTTACTITGAPAHLFPTTATTIPIAAIQDNTLNHPGQIDISTGGVWTLSFYSTISNLTGTFTNSGSKGMGGQSLSYSLQ
jgi:hypothetical protein